MKKLPQLSTQTAEEITQIVEAEIAVFGKKQSVVNAAILVFRDAPAAKKLLAVQEANRLLSEQLRKLGRTDATAATASFQPEGDAGKPSRKPKGKG